MIHSTFRPLFVADSAGGYAQATHEEILSAASFVADLQYANGPSFTDPKIVRGYLAMKLRGRPNEVFMGLFLNSQNRLIEARELFQGTINTAAVYPREIARQALLLNAAGIIVAHNHPSGVPTPSHADERVTVDLKAALRLIDVVLLDHFVVGRTETVSFAEIGLI
ncbi:RadC family protein [Ancylobacter oerskovii]|uniref:DNA repair protein RadC n=1 Tax=Ancylobacter oerskovii TaxID=459519 RepID=A0ABW4Z5L2_9HYPH|nr:DNA repair protein RadC [Ancylobacter oerskovii]MBS7545539.1 DNA repair protein RadC [Ancylobacter oerskovii]